MSATDNAASPPSGVIWLELGLTIGAMFGARLLAGTVHGAPSFVLRAVAGLLLIALLVRSSRLAERVARRKGIYHPQYFVLGPIGLVMALAARNRTLDTGGPADTSPTRPASVRKRLNAE